MGHRDRITNLTYFSSLLDLEIRGTIYFLLAYATNAQVGLTAAEKKTLRGLVKQREEGP